VAQDLFSHFGGVEIEGAMLEMKDLQRKIGNTEFHTTRLCVNVSRSEVVVIGCYIIALPCNSLYSPHRTLVAPPPSTTLKDPVGECFWALAYTMSYSISESDGRGQKFGFFESRFTTKSRKSGSARRRG
jgi:hypothetical protein